MENQLDSPQENLDPININPPASVKAVITKDQNDPEGNLGLIIPNTTSLTSWAYLKIIKIKHGSVDILENKDPVWGFQNSFYFPTIVFTVWSFNPLEFPESLFQTGPLQNFEVYFQDENKHMTMQNIPVFWRKLHWLNSDDKGWVCNAYKGILSPFAPFGSYALYSKDIMVVLSGTYKGKGFSYTLCDYSETTTAPSLLQRRTCFKFDSDDQLVLDGTTCFPFYLENGEKKPGGFIPGGTWWDQLTSEDRNSVKVTLHAKCHNFSTGVYDPSTLDISSQPITISVWENQGVLEIR